MFGIEYSKSNFTLLRFTKSQLGLDEHVCVYRGSKGEHTVSFLADDAQRSFIIPPIEPPSEHSPYVGDLQAMSAARLAFEMNDQRAARRCERLVDMVCDAASRVLPSNITWKLVVTPISEIAVIISGVFVGVIKVGIFGPNIELIPDWEDEILAIRGPLQEEESLHEVRESIRRLQKTIEAQVNQKSPLPEEEEDDECPFCESSWDCECRYE